MDNIQEKENAPKKSNSELYQELMDNAYEREVWTKEGSPYIPYYDFCDKLANADINLGAGINASAAGGFDNTDKKFLDANGKGHIVANDGTVLTFTSSKQLDTNIKAAFGYKREESGTPSKDDKRESWNDAMRRYRRPKLAEKSRYASDKDIQDVFKEETLSGRQAKAAKLPEAKQAEFKKLEEKFDKEIEDATTRTGIPVDTGALKTKLNLTSSVTLTDGFNKTASIQFGKMGLLDCTIPKEEVTRLNASLKKTHRDSIDNRQPDKTLQDIIAQNSPADSLVLQSFVHWSHAGIAHFRGGSGYTNLNVYFRNNLALFTQQVKQGYWDDQGIAMLEKTGDKTLYKYTYPKEDYEDKNNGLVNTYGVGDTANVRINGKGNYVKQKVRGNTWAEAIHNNRIDGISYPSSMFGKTRESIPRIEPLPARAAVPIALTNQTEPALIPPRVAVEVPQSVRISKRQERRERREARREERQARKAAQNTNNTAVIMGFANFQPLQDGTPTKSAAHDENATAQSNEPTVAPDVDPSATPTQTDTPNVLNATDEAKAIQWYADLKVTTEQITKIQGYVNAPQNGIVDAAFVQYVAQWQTEKNTYCDGEFGDKSAIAAGDAALAEELKKLKADYNASHRDTSKLLGPDLNKGFPGKVEELFGKGTVLTRVETADTKAWTKEQGCETEVEVTVTDKDGNDATKTMYVHKNLVSKVQAAFTEIHNDEDAKNYKFYTLSPSYAWRKIGGQSYLSTHSYGVAFDVNPPKTNTTSSEVSCVEDDLNPYYTQHKKVMGLKNDTDSVETKGGETVTKQDLKDKLVDSNTAIRTTEHPVVKILAKHGFGWGGSYGDYMHFSYFGGW